MYNEFYCERPSNGCHIQRILLLFCHTKFLCNQSFNKLSFSVAMQWLIKRLRVKSWHTHVDSNGQTQKKLGSN